MRFFRADYIHPQRTLAFTTDLQKIGANLAYLEDFSRNIAAKKNASPGAPFTLMTVMGRWLVVYMANGLDDEDTMQYFIDFRVELDGGLIAHFLSERVIGNLKVLQFRYDEVYKDAMDVFEVSYAGADEKILKRNLVACDSDERVLEAAKALGALPMIQSLNDPDKLKVTLVDEKLPDGDTVMVNIYALIHFGKTESENSGLAYLKLYDLLHNYDLTDDFLEALEKLGGKFERTFFMERFSPERWN